MKSGSTFATGIAYFAMYAVIAGCTKAPAHIRSGTDDLEDVQDQSRPSVDSARELDQEGVRQFHDGRYADAIRYFRAAHRLGGPSSELWNIARSQEKLDDPEGACATIDEYVAHRDLLPQERAEAEHEVRALRARPSVLTVTTMPAGAFVSVDGAPWAGPTPVSVEVLPGRHSVAVRRDGFASNTRSLEARFGHAIIVSLDLAPGRK